MKIHISTLNIIPYIYLFPDIFRNDLKANTSIQFVKFNKFLIIFIILSQ